MKDLLEPVHISLERRSLATARTVKEWALATAAIVLVVALLPVVWFSWTQIPFWAKGARKIIAHADKLAGEASTAMDKSRQASEETLKRTQELQATIATATGTFDEATQALAQLKTSIAAIEKSATETIDGVHETTGHLNTAVDALTETIKATSETVNGPAVKGAITDLAASAKELTLTTKAATGAAQELNGTVADVHAVTTHFKNEILAPVSKVKRMFGLGWEILKTKIAQLVP
jgi:methyl-accepting chemotaxis protein